MLLRSRRLAIIAVEEDKSGPTKNYSSTTKPYSKPSYDKGKQSLRSFASQSNYIKNEDKSDKDGYFAADDNEKEYGGYTNDPNNLGEDDEDIIETYYVDLIV